MKTPPKILAVDDDPEILEVVKHCLSGANYDVMTLAAGAKVLEVVDAENIDLVILDIGLPDISGLELTRQLKGRTEIGLIILSGLDEPTERVIGLEIGADDYVTKPFLPRELLARVRSVLRRLEQGSSPEAGMVYQFGGWSLDPSSRALTSVDGELKAVP